MLLPEPNRRSLPFVASLTVQCSLVLLLAIPWTVQTLRNRASLELPVVLNIRPFKTAEPPTTAQPPDTTRNSLPTLNTQIRVFHAPPTHSTNPTNTLPAAPDIPFDPGAPIGIGEATHVPDVIARSGPGPTIPPIAETKADPPKPVVVGGKVQGAKLIRQVQPIYPALARQIRVQGVVTLEAIIGADGTIQQLRLLNGHPLLAPSAIQAVQQWLYSPTVLNGKAVEVKTTIEVRFTLS